MSTRLILPLILFTFYSTSIFSQSCNSYYSLEEGTRWVTETFDKNDQFATKSVKTVSETGFSEGVFTGKMKGEVFDNMGQQIGTLDYEVKCQDGNFLVSMNSFLNPEQMGAYENMEVEIDGDFLQLPSDLQPGMTLPDASVAIKMKKSGIEMMSLTILIFDRQVEKFESITTPAGTFNCAKIVYGVQSKMGQAIPINVKTSGAEWLAKGTGMVKSEQYDENQNLMSYSLLTEFNK